jgi:hypothetical protein
MVVLKLRHQGYVPPDKLHSQIDKCCVLLAKEVDHFDVYDIITHQSRQDRDSPPYSPKSSRSFSSLKVTKSEIEPM